MATTFCKWILTIKKVIQNDLKVELLTMSPLTLYLMGGGALNAPPLAKSAPVHQGLTFDWPEVITIHICTYIIRLISLQGQKLPRKSFRVPFLRQGSFFKINERNISEATELCEGSK